jgi:chromatin remodeling complex protein RSC6
VQIGAEQIGVNQNGAEQNAVAQGGAEQGGVAQGGAEPAAEDVSKAPAEHPVQLTIDAISDRVKSCMAYLKETDGLIRNLVKDTKKLCKKRGGSGKPSNLTQPLGISSDLADFIGVGRESQMTRGSVTKAINEYAVREGLKLPDNGRIIKLDDKLAALLGKARDTEIPIINVQSHLRDHYVKNVAPVAAAAAV